MPSRLVARLAERIAAETDPARRACLRAQYSIQRARQGRRDEAEAIVRAIREEFAARPHGEVTAWVSLAEALNSFYTHPGPQALDRLKRAHALSRAMAHPLLQPLCAAWLAHMAFNDNRMDDMVRHAEEALRLAQPEHHAALARVCLVVADAYHYAGRFDLAQPWYAAVREHALADGDDATISAMLHNVATFRANNVRLGSAFQSTDKAQASRAMLEAESTRNYDLGVGTLSLDQFVPLLRAQLLTIDGQYEEAVRLFEAHLDHAEGQGMSRLLPAFLADFAWCCFGLGRLAAARSKAEVAVNAAGNHCDPDDLATTYARVAAVYNGLGFRDEASRLDALAIDALSEHNKIQQRMLASLQGAFVNGPPIF